jgi:hypothetical protein
MIRRKKQRKAITLHITINSYCYWSDAYTRDIIIHIIVITRISFRERNRRATKPEIIATVLTIYFTTTNVRF